MASVSSYRELLVWRKAMDLTVAIYTLTRRFPVEEKFGLTAQMRRAAASIAANIAEGQARRTTGEFIQSLGVARGSLAELETFLHLSARLEIIGREACDPLFADCIEINKMLNALLKSLASRQS